MINRDATSGKSVTLIILARILTNGTIANIAVVSCSENDTDKNTSSENVTAKPQVNLTVTKTVNLINVTIGDIITYTIEVSNDGPSDATSIEVHEDFGGTVDIIAADPSKGNYSNGVWTIDELGFDEGASLTLTVMVKKAETVENTVTA